MPKITTLPHAHATLAALCDEAIATREPIIIRRHNAEDVALIAAQELTGLLETMYLLRTPKNASRLLTALERAQESEPAASSVASLRAELGIREGES